MYKRSYVPYIIIFAALSVAILYGITFKAWNPDQAENKDLQYASVELVNEWIFYTNSTESYQYGVKINITKIGQ